MVDQLILQLSWDEDGSIELFARVESCGFGGYGSAYFSPDELSRFSAQLAQAFPFQEPLEIRGGHWSASNHGILDQELLGLTFYPVAGRGVAGCQVRLASPLHLHDRAESQSQVRTELLTSYQAVQEFAQDLRKLLTKHAEEAVLRAISI